MSAIGSLFMQERAGPRGTATEHAVATGPPAPTALLVVGASLG